MQMSKSGETTLQRECMLRRQGTNAPTHLCKSEKYESFFKQVQNFRNIFNLKIDILDQGQF